MPKQARFEAAFPYQRDILALPVVDIDAAAHWYAESFGMVEVERRDLPAPTVILERDGTRIGFSANGGDASSDGAAILVSGIGDIVSVPMRVIIFHRQLSIDTSAAEADHVVRLIEEALARASENQ